MHLAFPLAIALVLHATALGEKAPRPKPFERFDRCVVEPNEWTDGDSFRVRLSNGRVETFRLYFVDTTESRAHSSRSDEQAAYFGITKAEAVQLGKVAQDFTARTLKKPFTIHTRWRPVFGPTRYYAIVRTADRLDLNELLVSAGLARIYGTRTPLPEGHDSRTYLARLQKLESEAKLAGRGGWAKRTVRSRDDRPLLPRGVSGT